MDGHTISDHEFSQFRELIHRIAGISLSPAKKALVCGRLAKRLSRHQLGSYGEYFRLLTSGQDPGELQIAVDLLTTNETYFFREPRHFEYLRDRILPQATPGRPFRAWSAACSTGEEPYSIAMVLADHFGEGPWEVLASDICTRVLEKARTAHYPLERARLVAERHLSRYCLKGVGSQKGTLLVDRRLRSRVSFAQINLNRPLPEVGEFDVIFLRNVMIYFDAATKREVVNRLACRLRPGGHFIIGHSESLNGIEQGLQTVKPSIYRRPEK